jgi:hypothetical protein
LPKKKSRAISRARNHKSRGVQKRNAPCLCFLTEHLHPSRELTCHGQIYRWEPAADATSWSTLLPESFIARAHHAIACSCKWAFRRLVSFSGPRSHCGCYTHCCKELIENLLLSDHTYIQEFDFHCFHQHGSPARRHFFLPRDRGGHVRS